MEKLLERASRLLSVKAIVTIATTAVFAYLSVVGKLSDEFTILYASIISYYFGTQGERIQTLAERSGKNALD